MNELKKDIGGRVDQTISFPSGIVPEGGILLTETQLGKIYNTPYDDVYKTIIERAPYLFIPLVNEVFREKYDAEKTDIIPLKEEHHTPKGKRIPDSIFRIQDKKYMCECQSVSDGSIGLRMIEYCFTDALAEAYVSRKNKEVTSDRDTDHLHFSCPFALYLRGKRQRIRNIFIVLHLPDLENVEVKLPIVYIQSYELNEIVEKELYIFVPFYMMRYEIPIKRLVQMKETSETDRDKIKNLEEELLRNIEKDIEYILREMLDYFSKKNNTYCFNLLKDLLKNIFTAIIPATGKEIIGKVEEIMGGHALTTPTTQIFDEGIQQGIEQGIDQGEEKLGKLIDKLLTMDRIGDIRKAIKDKVTRHTFYKEFDI